MRFEDMKALSELRFEHARECLSAAESMLAGGNYKSAANRAYYAAFHAMRSVLAYDGIDMKKHTGVISEFRRLYLKSGIFEKELSAAITILFDYRTGSDYDDFYVISKNEIEQANALAARFLRDVRAYLDTKQP